MIGPIKIPQPTLRQAQIKRQLWVIIAAHPFMEGIDFTQSTPTRLAEYLTRKPGTVLEENFFIWKMAMMSLLGMEFEGAEKGKYDDTPGEADKVIVMLSVMPSVKEALKKVQTSSIWNTLPVAPGEKETTLIRAARESALRSVDVAEPFFGYSLFEDGDLSKFYDMAENRRLGFNPLGMGTLFAIKRLLEESDAMQLYGKALLDAQPPISFHIEELIRLHDTFLYSEKSHNEPCGL